MKCKSRFLAAKSVNEHQRAWSQETVKQQSMEPTSDAVNKKHSLLFYISYF